MQRLRDDFALNLPKTVDELVLVPGVCQKMDFWCLYAAWDISVFHGLNLLRSLSRLGYWRCCMASDRNMGIGVDFMFIASQVQPTVVTPRRVS